MEKNCTLTDDEITSFSVIADALSCGFGSKDNIKETNDGYYDFNFSYGEFKVKIKEKKKTFPFMTLLANSGNLFWNLHSIVTPDDFIDTSEVRFESNQQIRKIKEKLEKVPVCMSQSTFNSFIHSPWDCKIDLHIDDNDFIGFAVISFNGLEAVANYSLEHFGEHHDSLSPCLAMFSCSPELARAVSAIGSGAKADHPEVVNCVRKIIETHESLRKEVTSENWKSRLESIRNLSYIKDNMAVF